MKGLYIIAAAAVGFGTGCADKAEVRTPTPAATNAAIPATPVARDIEAPSTRNHKSEKRGLRGF
jgi:hypothetical protein